jgi:hypothetical protein
MAKCDHNFPQHLFLKLDLTALGGTRSLANQTSLLLKVIVEDATFSLSICRPNFKWNRTKSITTHFCACERIELSSCSMLTTKVEPSEVSVFRFIPAASAGRAQTLPTRPWRPPSRGNTDGKNRRRHWHETVSSALNWPFLNQVSQNCFVFALVNFENWGSLAELLRFCCCQVKTLRKSRRIAGFSMLSSYNIEEVWQDSFVFKLAER